MKPYNLNILTQVVQSGWNGDFYFSREEADALGLGAHIGNRHRLVCGGREAAGGSGDGTIN